MATSSRLANIATIPKNQREELRITLENYNGYNLVSQRVWFVHDFCEMRPGKQGVVIQLHYLPDLIDALQDARDQAEQLGLLEPE
jgi:hypothetical protein